MKPTALELWYEANLVARTRTGEVFGKDGRYYMILTLSGRVIELNDRSLELLLV